VQKGKIARYEGATGQPLGELSVAGDFYFDDVKATADGGLVAASRRHRDDIVRMDSSGKVLKVIEKAISGQTDSAELDQRVTTDGVGNIYSLGTFNDAVFKFTSDGRYVNRFGGDGDKPGQFRAPSSVAVDNQGRVYVSDFKGVQVFDADGRYLDVIQIRGALDGIVFNDQNELLVAARTQIYKFALNNQ
jgi:sugar lactone lactonase YvrE